MKTRLALITTALSTAALTAAITPPASAAPDRLTFDRVELPVAQGREPTGFLDINERGQIAGQTRSNETGQTRIVRWDPVPGGGYRATPLTPDTSPRYSYTLINDLGDVLGWDGRALVLWDARGRVLARRTPQSNLDTAFRPDLNNRRQVLHAEGYSFGGFPTTAVLWGPDGATELPNPAGGSYIDPGDLDERGVVTGTVFGGPQPPSRAGFRWDGQTVTRFTGPDDQEAWMIDANDWGMAVGMTKGTARTFVNHRGVSRDIGTLGGPQNYLHPLIGGGINNRGQVTGSSVTADGHVHPFIWQGGKMTDLGTLGGEATRAYHSTAIMINDRGQVIGTSITADGTNHPYLWHQGRMYDLHVPGSSQARPVDINDRGRTVGVATTDGEDTAVVWTPRLP